MKISEEKQPDFFLRKGNNIIKYVIFNLLSFLFWRRHFSGSSKNTWQATLLRTLQATLIKTVSFFVSFCGWQWSLPISLEFGATRVLLFIKCRCTEPSNMNSAQIFEFFYTPECGFLICCKLHKLPKIFCFNNCI